MKRKMPSRKQIAAYWREHSDREKLWDVQGDDCFACGDILRLERCHIVPRHKGGTDAVDNLHVLCARCHVASEGHEDYWWWFDRQILDFGIGRILFSHSPDKLQAMMEKHLSAGNVNSANRRATSIYWSHKSLLEELRRFYEASVS